jgi:protein SMG6
MDDIILRAVGWQKDHFTDRSAIVNPSAKKRKVIENETTQVVLVTFDRNLRLKARARGLDAADEKEMARMVKMDGENG